MYFICILSGCIQKDIIPDKLCGFRAYPEPAILGLEIC